MSPFPSFPSFSSFSSWSQSIALASMACAVCAVGVPAYALDAGCKLVAESSLKRLDAPAFHMEQHVGTFSKETLKADGKLFERLGGGNWALSRISLNQIRVASAETEKWLLGCQREGGETVDGVATVIYRFTIKDPSGGKDISSRVWIGASDGLPYREEGPSVKGRTRYRDVKAPL